jgi:2,3,4,5-tetrahydropyridine-2,6-dicarboxylate N-succinyltransferase
MDHTLAAQRAPAIEAAFSDRTRLAEPATREAVEEVIAALDAGRIRVASREAEGWVVHPWVKQAILLYFALRAMERFEAGPLAFQDKIPVKVPPRGVRVVPPGTVRYGAYVAPGAIVMPGYVNIGAYVDRGTMVDTWATVGSCAQIGGTYTSRAASGSAACSSRRGPAPSSSRTARSSARAPSWWRASWSSRRPCSARAWCSPRAP